MMLDMLRVASKRYLWLVNARSVKQVWRTRPTPSRIISILLASRQAYFVNNDKHYPTTSRVLLGKRLKPVVYNITRDKMGCSKARPRYGKQILSVTWS